MPDSWPRRRLLAILRGASEPLDAQELARMTGQHVTTVRFHLDVLTRESLVRQVQQPPRGRGRPRIGYCAVQRSVGYQELAHVLADQLGHDPRYSHDAAVDAGRAWGARLAAGEPPPRTVVEAREAVLAIMSELGFGPEREVPERESDEISDQACVRLTACPLRDLARTHSEVVCGVHLGMLRGLIEQHAAGRTGLTVDLQPFWEPDACAIRIGVARQARVDPSIGRGSVVRDVSIGRDDADLVSAERSFTDPATAG
ncbi:helix-turn-helix transcriptional regulator [Skermania piniformis]|uniref:Transcriptional regulator n=1 Tax=Skermania pinensis TaxID=39122 RepID=A0ABX8S628_9ACTN|nr:helix-turn-helix domain-containing protein [Skermania piniformis]QXQ13293.1 transcriptional regulator [Skermania piniformis]